MAKLALLVLVASFASANILAEPWQDSDMDGVPDRKDACADTQPQVVVDARGCSKSAMTKQGIKVMPLLCLKTSNAQRYPAGCSDTELSSVAVRFEFARAEVLLSQYQALERLARWLSSNNVVLQLIGHTDSVGEPNVNLQLSLERAEQVKKSLVEQFGFAAERFQIKGVGSMFPVANNQTALGRAQNRRVEFVVIVQ
ncbi:MULTISPECIES: OmpA family protein [unclassified Shewanella]|uniref:OmpA family protein n=1 Tax=unclassified Shewanella TaxID=196818 RepID=UPI001BC0E7DD|nr:MULTISPECIES: OmpA family protein [unclassified Shewanella]GIU09160.1 membrane protein [Shewanella sp. MBTL60-112-B1]GIU29023.1 membrane protein [Shewanella sp. MBTL60-112-B2]